MTAAQPGQALVTTPAPAAEPDAGRVYIGRQSQVQAGGPVEVVVLSGGRETGLQPVGLYATDFEWGRANTRAVELALSILADHLDFAGGQVSLPRLNLMAANFAQVFIFHAPPAGFEIEAQVITNWLACWYPEGGR